MTETNIYAQAAQNYITGAKSQVVTGLDGSPDDAARVVQLESATGVPSAVINQNPEQFEANTQRAMATHLVSQNPQLMAYVHSHPMAAGVSSDDWGALDEFSRGAGVTHSVLKALNAPWDRAVQAGASGAVTGFKEGFGHWPSFQPGPTAAGNLVQSAGLLGQVINQGLGGVFRAMTQGVGDAATAGAKALGVDPSTAEGLGRDLSAMTEYHLISPGGDFVAAHEEPPKGINPHVDQAKAEINAQALEHLDKDVAAAQASATKERSPEMFQRLAEQHYGNATLGVHSDAALELYGSKLPTPDDGLLGWVPGIADKLESAKLTGSDVEVPVADWVSKVDPTVMEKLHDDLRLWPGGITAREAGEATPPTQVDENGVTTTMGEGTEPEKQGIPFEYKQMVDSPLAQVRGAFGLEPMFAQGDRKLTLERNDGGPGNFTIDPAAGMHGFDILDEKGNAVGGMVITPEGKNLVIENVEGVWGMHANAFGPSLMRDLLKQLKAQYPEAETLSGYRISGARAKAGARDTATVKLEAGDHFNDYEKATDILHSAWKDVGQGVSANLQPSDMYLAKEKEIASAIHEEVGRITGGKARVVPTAGLRYREGTPAGAYLRSSRMGPTVFYDLLGDDPVGVARHESIHWLKDQGLITLREWNTLTSAAEAEGWHDRYGIRQRYADSGYAHDSNLMNEESVAEAFREWARTMDGTRREGTPVSGIFQKIKDFLTAMMGRISGVLGHQPTAEELFGKISSGEIGSRPGSITSGVGPQFAMEDLDNLKASGLGLDLKTFQNIQKLVQERYRQDVETSVAQAERYQAKKLSKEWADNRASMRPEVEATIRQRPDVAADLFIGSGELYGEKLQQRFTLRQEDLSPEQRSALPAHYMSKNGLPVDEVGKMFGYPSGEAMVQRLTAYNALKEGKSPQAFLKDTVDRETDRQMEAKYGNLGANILTEAKDQALSKNDLNLLTEEYHAAAMQAGTAAVDKDTILAKARDLVDRTPLNEVDFNKQLTLTGRHYRDAVRALANGDAASAVISLEKRTLAAHVASEMKKVQAEKGKFDVITKRYAKPWDPTKATSVEPNFSIFTRDVLQRVGLRNGMSTPGLAKAISESGFDGLSDFVTKTEDTNKISGLELPVPSWLLNLQPGTKQLETLPVADFREVRDSVTVLDKVGRADQKIIKAGEALDRKEWINEASAQLKAKFDPLPSKQPKGFKHALNTFVATMTSNETLMSRFDGRDPHGIFTETITKPGAEAANREARLQRETAAKYRDLGDIKEAERTLSSPFIDPRTGKPLDFNRRNLAAVISNMGNNYNWSILAKGWKVDPAALMQWVEKVSTPEDIERAQSLGNIFKGLKSEADKEYNSLYGISPENVVPRPFTMHGKQYDGWYHPIIGDPQLSRFVNKMPSTEVEHNFWPSTSNAYMKRRTGAVQVVDLTYDSIPAKMSQVMHDISFRAFVANTAKIFKDTGFRNTILERYGKPYMEEMDKWLQSLAGDASYNTGAMQLATKLSNTLRQNVISTQIAFNLGTMEKHGLTAGLMSARELNPNLLKSLPEFGKVFAEVAPSLFKRAVRDMTGKSADLGDSLFDFVKSNSEEIQRRERNFMDTMVGQQAVFEGKNTFRQQLTQWGAKGVAFSDMLSAAPLWLAKYRSEMEANGGVHGDAVREADMAVRRAHGSTAITNLPSIARGSGPVTPWLTSLYGFMGTSMQRRIEIFHDVNDAYKLGMQGQIREAAKFVPSILSSTAVYVAWTGLVEELVSGQFTDDRRGLGSKALTFLFGTVAQSMVGLRDLVYDLEAGRESAGLISTPINDLIHLKRDISKNAPLAKQHAGQLLQDGCTALGDLGGVCPKHLGTLGHYGLDVFNGFQHPRTPSDVYRGAISGKQQLHVVK